MKGDKYYLSNYRAGIRVLDISQIGDENITELGFFDTYPDSNSANFNGAWSVYPFFASNNIVISDIDRGFFLVRDPSLGLDTGVIAITSPTTGSGLSDAEVVTIEIQNFGTNTQTSIPVFYSLDGAAAVNETYTGSIAQGATDTYSFTTTVDLSELTDYIIVAGTELPGDIDTSNDDTTAEVSNFLCQPETNCTFGDGLRLVSVEEINNSSGCETDGYGDFTNLIANLAQGETYDITLSTGYGNQFVKIWIDFNEDFAFSDNEVILNNYVIAPGSTAGNFIETTTVSIPSNATLGAHTMRVKTNWNEDVPEDACEETAYGETEDYTATIIEDVLGWADVALIDFEIAPNPAKENITITATCEPIESVEVFNILGQRVLYLTFDATMAKNIKINSLNSGMYLIKINTQITKRLIVK